MAATRSKSLIDLEKLEQFIEYEKLDLQLSNRLTDAQQEKFDVLLASVKIAGDSLATDDYVQARRVLREVLDGVRGIHQEDYRKAVPDSLLRQAEEVTTKLLEGLKQLQDEKMEAELHSLESISLEGDDDEFDLSVFDDILAEAKQRDPIEPVAATSGAFTNLLAPKFIPVTINSIAQRRAALIAFINYNRHKYPDAVGILDGIVHAIDNKKFSAGEKENVIRDLIGVIEARFVNPSVAKELKVKLKDDQAKKTLEDILSSFKDDSLYAAAGENAEIEKARYQAPQAKNLQPKAIVPLLQGFMKDYQQLQQQERNLVTVCAMLEQQAKERHATVADTKSALTAMNEVANFYAMTGNVDGMQTYLTKAELQLHDVSHPTIALEQAKIYSLHQKDSTDPDIKRYLQNRINTIGEGISHTDLTKFTTDDGNKKTSTEIERRLLIYKVHPVVNQLMQLDSILNQLPLSNKSVLGFYQEAKAIRGVLHSDDISPSVKREYLNAYAGQLKKYYQTNIINMRKPENIQLNLTLLELVKLVEGWSGEYRLLSTPENFAKYEKLYKQDEPAMSVKQIREGAMDRIAFNSNRHFKPLVMPTGKSVSPGSEKLSGKTAEPENPESEGPKSR